MSLPVRPVSSFATGTATGEPEGDATAGTSEGETEAGRYGTKETGHPEYAFTTLECEGSTSAPSVLGTDRSPRVPDRCAEGNQRDRGWRSTRATGHRNPVGRPTKGRDRVRSWGDQKGPEWRVHSVVDEGFHLCPTPTPSRLSFLPRSNQSLQCRLVRQTTPTVLHHDRPRPARGSSPELTTHVSDVIGACPDAPTCRRPETKSRY